MIAAQIAKIKKYCTDTYGIRWNTNYVIVGIRGFDVSGFRNSDEIDQFNDTILVVNEKEAHAFQCTMDPGLDWVRKPMAAVSGKGTARLAEGSYIYVRGKHKGIDAFTQGSQIIVRRDKDRDAIWEEHEPLETGWFAVNIHPKLKNSKNVSTNSAGCTVINSMKNEKPWLEFQSMLYRSSQMRFPYIVLDQLTAIKVIQ